MKYKLTFALVASMTGSAFAAFQAPLPEFKNEKQLAEWRAEKASESARQGYAAEETAFYTGKPYLASSGGYAFKYRSYNPELARWTSEDPSGFPDGANGSIYAPSPTRQLDSLGLDTVTVTGIPEVGSDGAAFSIVVEDYAHQVNGQIQGQMVVGWRIQSSLSGYVVQHLQFHEQVQNDDGSSWTPTEEWTPFWEAFRVDGGVAISSDIYLTDIYGSETNGSFKVIGKVDFYSDSVFSSTNSPSTWSTTAMPMSGGLPAIGTAPSWLSGSGFNHNLTMTWE